MARRTGVGGTVYSFRYRSYSRLFVSPLETAHGVWAWREGAIVRLEDTSGRVSFGEVAPLPGWGSETLVMAEAFLRSLGDALSEEQVRNIPPELKACRFALSAAMEGFRGEETPTSQPPQAILLPAGERALSRLHGAPEVSAYKWKIGVCDFEQEAALFREIRQVCEARGARLRLDANCGLDTHGFERWQELLAGDPVVDYLEQPFPPGQEAQMQALAEKSGVTIALDESVRGAEDVHRLVSQGWSGPLVIKPLIFGPVESIRALPERYPNRLCFSSVFETAVGRRQALSLAAALSNEPVGFDTLWAFDDGLGEAVPEAVWEALR